MAINDNNMKDRIRSEQSCMRPITNDDLICKNCMYRHDDSVVIKNVSICDMYDFKPSSVFKGKCDFYDKE